MEQNQFFKVQLSVLHIAANFKNSFYSSVRASNKKLYNVYICVGKEGDDTKVDNFLV